MASFLTGNKGQMQFVAWDNGAPGGGQITLVSGISGFSIVVVSIMFTISGAGATVQFQDNAGSPNVLSGAFDFAGVYSYRGTRNSPLMACAPGVAWRPLRGGTCNFQGFATYFFDPAE